MVKHFKEIMAISVLLFILMMIIPASFAHENQTGLQLDAYDDALSETVDIYFDASAVDDGDGSKEKPYNTIDSSKLQNNSNIYLNEGDYILESDGISLENVSIYGKGALNTAIYAHDSNWDVVNVNTGGVFSLSNLTLKSMRFNVASGGFAASDSSFILDLWYKYDNGGAIASSADTFATIDINRCSFHNYTACYGAAIFCDNGILNIENSGFYGNYVFPYQYVLAEGGAILVHNSTAKIRNSYFRGNSADYSGGAICNVFANMTVFNCTFEDNEAHIGGAINNQEGNLTVIESTFENNDAAYGAVKGYLGNIIISDSRFSGNHAKYGGGAVCGEDCGLSLSSSEFFNNSAKTSGGSLYLLHSRGCVISNSSFEDDYSSSIGGSIFLENSEAKLTDINIEGSKSLFGAGIGGLDSTVTLNGVNVNNCNAKYYGGAIYDYNGEVSIQNSSISQNSADKGGAIYSSYSSLCIDSSIITDNLADIGTAGYLFNASAQFNNITLKNNEFVTSDSFEPFYGNGNYTLMKVNDTFNGNLPSRYNSADYGYITPVSDQLNGDYCWAFSTIAVLESCVAKASGIKYDFSENNLVNLNRKYSAYGRNTSAQAGNAINALGYLLSWLGPVNESDDTYDANSKISPVLNSLMHVQNVMFLDMKYDDSDRDTIKQAIMRYGAVGTSIYWMQLYPLQNGSSYYHYSDEPALANHAITLVGWDDNYSRDNFGLTPPGDGAWICKNTWGTGIGDNGYFYISYYSNSLNYQFYSVNDEYMNLDRVFTIILNDTIRLDRNYQYDYSGPTDSWMFDNGACLKNVFTATEDEYLAAVSTYFLQDTSYDIIVYVNDEPVHTQTSTSKPGYYTINLDKIIPLKANDTFAVGFKMNNLNGDYFEFYCSQKDGVAADFYRNGMSQVSYPGYEDEWYTTGGNSVFCIKAFTILNELETSLDLTVDYKNTNPVNITATVTDEYGRKVMCGNVTFRMEGREFVVNVSNGAAKMTYNFKKGASTIEAAFNALGYEQSSGSVDVEVYKEVTELNLDVSTYLNTVSMNFTTPVNISSLMEVVVNNKSHMMILMNGKASLYIDNLDYGDNEISASLYNCRDYDAHAEKTVFIEVIQPKIVSADFETYGNSNANYTVRLVDDKSNPISSKQIMFNLNGRDFKANTDENGEATLAVDLLAGKYKIKVLFAGDEKNLPVNATNDITVKQVLSADVGVFKRYRDIDVDIALSRNIDIDLKVDVNHITYEVSVINGKGNLKILDLKNGDYNLVVYLVSDEYYFNNVEENFTINAVETKIVSADFETLDEDKESYTVKLLDRDRDPIKSKTVKFSIDGNDIEVITDKNGEASLPLDLAAGNYIVETVFEGDGVYMPSNATNNIRIISNLESEIKVVKNGRSAEISVLLSKDVDVDLIISINGKNQTLNSKDTLKLNDLENRDYNVRVYLNSDVYVFKSSTSRFSINVIDTKLEAGDLTVYAGTDSKFKAKLLDANGEEISGKTVLFTVNGNVVKAVTDNNGVASIAISDLPAGKHNVKVDFEGFKNYVESSAAATITVKTTISLPSNDIYTFNCKYSVKLYDGKGNPLNGKSAEFNINGISRQVKCTNGIANLNVDFEVGNYTVKVTNPATGEVKTQNITVMPRLIENKGFTMYYGAGKYYKVRLLDDNGNILKGAAVTIKLGSKSKQVTTDENGYASYKITSKPGKYTITATYNGFKVSDKITVKSTLVTKDMSVKKGKAFKFTAKLLNSKGKILKNKKVTFKFNGKTYKIKTDKKGIATLKVTKKLKAGKYAIKTTYGKLTVSNKITVKK